LTAERLRTQVGQPLSDERSLRAVRSEPIRIDVRPNLYISKIKPTNLYRSKIESFTRSPPKMREKDPSTMGLRLSSERSSGENETRKNG